MVSAGAGLKLTLGWSRHDDAQQPAENSRIDFGKRGSGGMLTTDRGEKWIDGLDGEE